jgi:hypothetical protein
MPHADDFSLWQKRHASPPLLADASGGFADFLDAMCQTPQQEPICVQVISIMAIGEMEGVIGRREHVR